MGRDADDADDADGGGGASGLVVELRLADRRCVVVGAGPVGGRRAAQLVEAGAEVVVVAPVAGERVDDLVRRGALRWERRAVRPADVADAFLVVVATDDAAVNASTASAAASTGALVDRADGGTAGPTADVAVAGAVRRGPMTVAVSTGGRAPAVAAWATAALEDGLDDVLGLDAAGVALLVEVVSEVRAELAAASGAGEPVVTPGRPDWRSALDGTMLDLIRTGRKAMAKERLQACLSSS